eukprot:gene8243-19323_t
MADGAASIEQITRHKGDYYAMLGVARGADEAELTKAYRKLSLK